MDVKQLKGKGRKCQLHAHLPDFMGKKNRGTKNRPTYMILLSKKSNQVSHARDSWREKCLNIGPSAYFPYMFARRYPLGSPASNAAKNLWMEIIKILQYNYFKNYNYYLFELYFLIKHFVGSHLANSCRAFSTWQTLGLVLSLGEVIM